MARDKKPNQLAKRFGNMDMAGGNHQAKTSKGIIQEGRKSYKHTVDQKLGTNHSKGINELAKRFAPIKQELGKSQPKLTQQPKQQVQAKQQPQTKQAPKPKGRTK